MQSSIVLALKFVAVDLVGSIFYFPIWWYSKGLVNAARYCSGKVRDAARQFGIFIWIKNLFRPMFGQHDVTSRIISFFMRLAVIAYYSVALVLLSVIMTVVFLLWLVLPIIIGSQFFGQLLGILRLASS
jgi:hypothetical protein